MFVDMVILTLDDGARYPVCLSEIDYFIPDTEGCWLKPYGSEAFRVKERYREIWGLDV